MSLYFTVDIYRYTLPNFDFAMFFNVLVEIFQKISSFQQASA